MASGLIPVVSQKTGNKYIVGRVDKNLIVNSFEPDDYAKKIAEIMKSDKKKRMSLSKRSKVLIKNNYTYEKQLKVFKKAFYKLIGGNN